MSTLPNKWAVEITSLNDAERLQALFHDAKSPVNDKFNRMYRDNAWLGKMLCFYMLLDWVNTFKAETNWILENRGYTILSITELENLMKVK